MAPEPTAAIAFGPVPSRRLGRNLGINNIPPKSCSYACVYCQVGRTVELTAERRAFYPPEEVVHQVETRVRDVRARGEAIDYLAFVPDGEPTLDVHLGQEIAVLRPLGVPVAVLSNACLVGRDDVQSDLLRADWLSLKVDAVREDAWRRLNRPHGRLRLDDQLQGGLRLSRRFAGTLATETLLVAGLNDDEGHIDELGRYLRADLLAITAVHPMREHAVADLLARTGEGWPVVQELVADGRLARREHGGRTFFVRRFTRPASAGRGGTTKRRAP
jgi:wyosine [tRNA(Phe)-imidazoG37] synthetase (radical SAM superfamily)